MSSDDELSTNTSSSCDVEFLQSAVEGEGIFNSIVQRYRVGSWKKETRQRGMRRMKMVYALRPENFDSKTRKQAKIGKL